MPRKKSSSSATGELKTDFASNLLAQIKWGESYTSLILGIVVVVLASILIVSFVKGLRQNNISKVVTQQTLSQKTEAIQEKPNLVKTYTVAANDDLWSISEKVYKSGYNWVDIAKANNIENPDVIYKGMQLQLPVVQPKTVLVSSNSDTELAKANDATTPIVTATETKANVITGDSYTVQKGDSLWEIAVRAYGDGYKWTEIAKVNNLTEPNLIFSQNTLKLPR